MRLKNRFMPALLFCGAVALSSCEKNEQETAMPAFEQGMISHVMADSAAVTAYAFSGKQLSQVNHYDTKTGKLESFDKYERDGSGKLVKATSYAAGNHALLSEQKYTYNTNGLLSKTEMAYYKGGKLEYSALATVEYDTKNNLKKKSLYEVNSATEEAIPTSYTTFELLPNGNYANEKQYVIDDKGEASLFSTTTYSYDSNQNPFHELAEPGSASSPNNMIASSALVHNSKKTYKYTYAYTYDERGYPLTQTVVSPTGKSETFNYLYSN
ncbi:hypothetical protein MKJ04_20510 [Pontibacter sp. E15-1]|uniref:hypothetical protein n=1 Tax=Pontibacter sp. E15-1 TaxID=2919918 RepID=UPI001F4FA0AA|nr:hypothetical protein [Pontibacter sp. E15-1]MCJ8167235.1 hypothetical protein [Pontibacter sp. E15-1]